MTKRMVLSALTALAVAAGPEGLLAAESHEARELMVVATADTDGDLATPRCRETPILTDERLSYARQVGQFRRVAPRARADEESFEPIALHLGDAAFPGPLGRFLLSRGDNGARRLARILAQMPYASVTLGNRELGLRRQSLNAFAEGAIAEGLPLRAANVVCSSEGSAEALCDATGQSGESPSYDLVERGDLRVLLVSVLDRRAPETVAPNRMTGLDILDPRTLLERRLPEWRSETDADLTMVQYHATSGTDVDDLVELSQSKAKIDVITTNRQLGEPNDGGSSGQGGFTRAPGSGTFILPTGPGPSQTSVAHLQLERVSSGGEGGEWRVGGVDAETVVTRSAPPDPTTAEMLWSTSEELCRTWGRAIDPEAPLDQPFERRDFATFVLNVMRHAGRAEVGLINDGAILDGEYFPIRRSLTYADVYTLLPYGNAIVIVRMRGDVLRELAKTAGGVVRTAGLEVSGTSVTVNGRPVREDRIYTVATNRYVADGGDEIVDPDDIENRRLHRPDWSSETPSISDTVVQFVTSRDYIASGRVARRLSPDGPFPDLHRKLLWSLVGSIHASFNQVAVTNPTVEDVPTYNQSQLRVQPTQQVHLEGSFHADADSRNHQWDNNLLVQYALARVDPIGGEGDLQETSDVIRGKSRYKYAGFRYRLGDPWWGPMPTGELQLETEVDRPDQRNWKKLEVTGILGSSFELTDRLEFRAGFDLRRDLNDPGAKTVYGVTAAYELRRTRLFAASDHPLEFESEFEYFYNDPFVERIHELRTTNRLHFSVYDDLDISSTFSAFLFRSGFVGTFGRNTEITIGVNYRWDEAIQTF